MCNCNCSDKNHGKSTGKFTAFNLASILASYPDEFFKADLKEILKNKELDLYCKSIDSEVWEKLKHELKNIIKNKISIDDIRSDYIDIFDRSKNHNSLYETEYGRERVMAKPNELADLAGFYKAFGLSNEDGDVTPEMVDHISVELEFYSYMLLKEIYLEKKEDSEGKEIVFDGRKKFIEDHLGRFTEAVSKRPGIVENNYYSLVFNWINLLVKEECKELGVQPLKIDLLSSQAEPEAVECALAGCGLSKG